MARRSIMRRLLRTIINRRLFLGQYSQLLRQRVQLALKNLHIRPQALGHLIHLFHKVLVMGKQFFQLDDAVFK